MGTDPVSYRPIADMWMLARCKYQGGVKRYGGYLGGFPERARALLGVTIDDPVLHVCGGLARLYPYPGGFGPNDKTLDLAPDVEADYCQDATDPLPAGFRSMLADPPYTEADADKYPPGAGKFPAANQIVRRMMEALLPGQRCGIIGYAVPALPPGARYVACIGIICGFNNRIRVFSAFEKGTVHAKAARRKRPEILGGRAGEVPERASDRTGATIAGGITGGPSGGDDGT